MSQAKVDKYKKEKKNRAKTVKKARVKRVTSVYMSRMRTCKKLNNVVYTNRDGELKLQVNDKMKIVLDFQL